ncbi:MAG: DNA alkylation repair protein [Clostridia bacterium]|nr:DNA alkylation repair protein [Clostridia bacterium]
MTDIQKDLFALRDEKYKIFHSKLMPTINPELIIGVRTPVLRKYALEIAKTDNAKDFIENLPHKYYEENNLHAFILEQTKDFDRAIYLWEKFLPYIDNWATCDMFSDKVFKNHRDKILPYVKKWLKSNHTYTVRYAIGILMNLFLDEHFKNEYMDIVSKIKSDEYYINMMIAWYFATALAKQYEAAIEYLEQKRLPIWIHNKTIQKAVESYRIPRETKEYLKVLKIK